MRSVITINENKVYSETCKCLPVWCDRVRRSVTDPVVVRLSPATGHIRCELLANQPK